MEIFTELEMIETSETSAITLGNFDGVHTGHQSLISKVISGAKKCGGGVPTAITFDPHPVFFLNGKQPGYLLTTLDEKIELFALYGIKRLIVQRFDEALRNTSAREYMTALSERLRPCELWVGHDFAFGFQREGNVDFLRQLGSVLNFTLHTPEFLTDEKGERVSSSLIRKMLVEGRVDTARRLLGRPYRVSGEVVPGSRRGRSIGFPTANVNVPGEKIIPSRGVYAAKVLLEGITYNSVVNVGLRPTFNLAHSPVVESHILDFDQDIYGEILTIDFIEKIRDEKKFDSIEKLVDQINEDIFRARAIFWSISHY